MKKLIGIIKKSLTFSLVLAMTLTGYIWYTCDVSCTKANAGATGYYDVKGDLLQAKQNGKSMGDAGIRKPLELIERNGKWFLRIELKSLKPKAGGFKGYLGKIEYFPGYEGKSDLKSAKSKPLSIKSYHDVYDEYNDPKRGSDKSLKGKRYPQYCMMPITPPSGGKSAAKQYWIKVYVPLMESLNPGGGTQYARLVIDWSSIKVKSALTNNPPDKSRLKPNKPHKKPHKRPHKNPNKKPDNGRQGDKREKIDIAKLKDGTYVIKGNMVKSDKTTYSMANAGIYHNVKLKVSGGNHVLVLRMKGMNVGGQTGYLKNMSYYDSGGFRSVRIMSYHSRNGSRIRDSYGTNYPNVVGIPISKGTLMKGYVPIKIFVPVMDAISRGTGTQSVYLKLDKDSIKKVDANSSIFNQDSGGSGTGNLPGGSSNLQGGSGLGTFNKSGIKTDKDKNSLSGNMEKLNGGEKTDGAEDNASENQKEEKKEPPLKKNLLPRSISLMMAASLIPVYRKRRKIFGRFIS